VISLNEAANSVYEEKVFTLKLSDLPKIDGETDFTLNIYESIWFSSD